MNLTLHEQLVDFIKNNPNTYGRYLAKSKPELYDLIKDCPGVRVSEKFFNYLNPDAYAKFILGCKMCKAPLKFQNGFYRIYCSNKCSTNDPDNKEQMLSGIRSDISKHKRKDTLLSKYGTLNMFNYERIKENNKLKALSNYWNLSAIKRLSEDACYVYVYLNPIKDNYQSSLRFQELFGNTTFTPFYVGKGNGDRKTSHLIFAKNGIDSNLHKMNTIHKIWNAGLEPLILSIIVETDEDANNLEKELINLIGTRSIIKGIIRGSLTNLTSGGEGGSVVSDEVLKKLSDSRKDKKWISDGIYQKFVHITELDNYLKLGWYLGMKPRNSRKPCKV